MTLEQFKSLDTIKFYTKLKAAGFNLHLSIAQDYDYSGRHFYISIQAPLTAIVPNSGTTELDLLAQLVAINLFDLRLIVYGNKNRETYVSIRAKAQRVEIIEPQFF